MKHLCNICQLEPEIVCKISDLVRDGVAQRKIVQSVKDEFKASITQASLNRHLNSCGTLSVMETVVSEDLALLRQKARLPVMTGRESFNVLCRLFHENMESYMNKVNIMKAEGVNVSEDDLKELDLLVKTHERLYPGEAKNKSLFTYDSSDGSFSTIL
jgi:hypothetical protein